MSDVPQNPGATLDVVDGRVSIDGLIRLCTGSALYVGPMLEADQALRGGPSMPPELMAQFVLGFQKAHEGIIAVLNEVRR